MPTPNANDAASLERERFVFQMRMDEAALALRERDQILQEARLAQQKAEWEQACRLSNEQTATERARQANERRLRVRLAHGLVALVPLFVALIPALWGYAAYLSSVKDMARASVANARDTARINAATERFKAVLDIKKDFFKHQDKVFENLLRVSSTINREVNGWDDPAPHGDPTTGNAVYQKIEDEFEQIYSTSAASVQSDDVSRRMILFHNGLVYLHHPTPENYDVLNRQRKEGVSAMVAGAEPTMEDLPKNAAGTVDILTQELAQSVKKAVEARSDPRQYPFLFGAESENEKEKL